MANIKKRLDMHYKITSIKNSLMDIDYCLAKNEDLDQEVKTIYKSIQNIKKLIVTDKIVFRGGR